MLDMQCLRRVFLSCVVLCTIVHALYLPGVAPNSYSYGQEVWQ